MSDFTPVSNIETDTIKENVDGKINPTEEKKDEEIEKHTSNGLENFHIDEQDTPELFNSDNSLQSEDTVSSSEQIDKIEEDDLEIPAFLRRQKN